jgi:hypothetical protein
MKSLYSGIVPKSKPSMKQTACVGRAGSLLDLLFNCEDGGDMLIQSGSWCSVGYRVLYPKI